MENFSELKLSPELTQAIEEMGYRTPTPIQAETLAVLLGGTTDFLGMAATGTGKTAAFGIPLLEVIDPKLRATQALVLCPTRELAIQVADQITLLGKHKRIHANSIYGGTGYSEQLRSLKRGSYVVVATPGRLIDHIKQGNLSLDNVGTVVFDEADEMISMGFKEDLEFLLKSLPKEGCQRWLFAATMSPELRRVADKYLRTPKLAQVNRKELLPGTVQQIYYTVREKNKPKGLCKLIDMADDFYGLIFCQTKALVVELTEYLRVRGYLVDCLHGNKSQSERERTLKLFKEKNVNMLVCSDVAARGLDVKELTHVINYSLPYELDSYVHRIGRTGRTGKTGIALSLVSPGQMSLINRIERVTKTKIEPGTFPTRKDISVKKLERLLPKFSNVVGHENARKILGEHWTQSLETMSKDEIAGRFLALTFPDLFDDREKAEEIGLREDQDGREGEDRPRSQRYGARPRRPQWGTARPRRGNSHPRRDARSSFSGRSSGRSSSGSSSQGQARHD